MIEINIRIEEKDGKLEFTGKGSAPDGKMPTELEAKANFILAAAVQEGLEKMGKIQTPADATGTTSLTE